MDTSEKPVNGAITVESLGLEGFIMIEKDKPLTVDELNAPVVGVYVSKEKSSYSNVYVIETENGPKAILGCTDLDAQMRKVKFGQTVAIVFEGQILTKSGNPMYRVQVWVK